VIVAKFRLFPPLEQRSEVLETLRSVQGPTQVKPSCLAVQLYQEEGPDAAILYIEEWDADPEFCLHVKSELYRRVLAAIDASKEAPELCFYRVSQVEGFELLQKIRGSGGEVAPIANTGSQSSENAFRVGSR
jgi:quinol monooxygenase YgiN